MYHKGKRIVLANPVLTQQLQLGQRAHGNRVLGSVIPAAVIDQQAHHILPGNLIHMAGIPKRIFRSVSEIPVRILDSTQRIGGIIPETKLFSHANLPFPGREMCRDRPGLHHQRIGMYILVTSVDRFKRNIKRSRSRIGGKFMHRIPDIRFSDNLSGTGILECPVEFHIVPGSGVL